MPTPQKGEFYTLKGYRMLSPMTLTESMEDYVEMICRLRDDTGHARINDLARRIHVSPSSASKMVNKLQRRGLVCFPKYGAIEPTEKGARLGAYLIWRHQTLERFLRLINGTDDETRQTEQIEHFFTQRTVRNIKRLCEYLSGDGWRPG